MPPSRPVPKGRVLTLDRRTTRRFFILRPDADRRSQRLLYYCLGVMSEKHGVLLHAVVQMSTHWHVCLTDVRGVLPEFLADVHRTLAMCLKVHRDWDEEVWNKSQTGVVDIETGKAALTQLAYVMCNPVEAGLVERVESYPGVVTRAEEIGRKVFRLKRPRNAYLKSAHWPRTTELRFVVPEILELEYGAQARRQIIEATQNRMHTLRAARKAAGKGYLGAAAVCAAAITMRATAEEVRGARKPTFAVGPGERERYRAKVAKLRARRIRYAYCLERWRAGDREVLWPPNTWKMRVLHGVRCAPPD